LHQQQRPLFAPDAQARRLKGQFANANAKLIVAQGVEIVDLGLFCGVSAIQFD